MRHTQLVIGNRKVKNMSEIGNNNWQLGKKTPIARVDALAEELVTLFDNRAYIKWYYVAIYDLGEERIRQILGRVSDARFPGKLFTHYVNQVRAALENQWKLSQLKKKFND
jgi:hypothetical protein